MRLSSLAVPAAFLAAACIAGGPALAAAGGDTEVFTTACSRLLTVKRWLFSAIYVLGAIGLVIIAVSAFLGKFRFAHLISLGGGLFIVAAADLLIKFLSDGDADSCVAS